MKCSHTWAISLACMLASHNSRFRFTKARCWKRKSVCHLHITTPWIYSTYSICRPEDEVNACTHCIPLLSYHCLPHEACNVWLVRREEHIIGQQASQGQASPSLDLKHPVQGAASYCWILVCGGGAGCKGGGNLPALLRKFFIQVLHWRWAGRSALLCVKWKWKAACGLRSAPLHHHRSSQHGKPQHGLLLQLTFAV